MKINFKKMRPIGFNKRIYDSVKLLAENVEKGHGNKKINRCPICQSLKKNLYDIKYNIPIFDCLKCDVGYAGLQPKNFDDVYSKDEYLNKSIASYDKTRNYRIIRFGKERVSILKKYKSKGSLLDFGCGTGWFMQSAKNTYDVEGIEFSDSLRKWMLKKYGLVTYKELSLTKKKYDIITLFDVIEHVPSPISLLKQLKSKLNYNGIILIYTPNKNSLGFDFLKHSNNLLCPPNHLFYFNKKSFDFLSKKLKFKILETQYRGLDIGDIFAYLREKKEKRIAEFLSKYATKFQNKIDTLEYSNHMRFVLKKL